MELLWLDGQFWVGTRSNSIVEQIHHQGYNQDTKKQLKLFIVKTMNLCNVMMLVKLAMIQTLN